MASEQPTKDTLSVDFDERLGTIRTLANERHQANELQKIAKQIPEDFLFDAFQIIIGFNDDALIADTILSFTPLAERQAQQWLDVVLNSSLSEHRQVAALEPVINDFTTPQQKQLLNKAQSFGDRYACAYAYEVIAKAAATDMQWQIISTLTSMLPQESDQERVINAMAPRMGSDSQLVQTAIDIAKAMVDPYARLGSLSLLVPALPLEQRYEMIPEVLHEIRSNESLFVGNRILFYRNLSPGLPEQLYEEVFNDALALLKDIELAEDRQYALVDIAHIALIKDKSLAEKYFTEAVDLVASVKDDTAIENAIYIVIDNVMAIAPELGRSIVDRLFENARQISDIEARTMVLSNLSKFNAQMVFDEENAEPIKESEQSTDTENLEEKLRQQDEATQQQRVPVDETIAEAAGLKQRAAKPREPKQPRPPIQPIAAHLHSDQWTLDDKLGYTLYATSIAEFVHHSDTKPPLTIGVLAPWGQGKTTLMQMIRHHMRQIALREQKDANEAEKTTNANANIEKQEQEALTTDPFSKLDIQPAEMTFGAFRRWIQIKGNKDRRNFFGKLQKLSYPTVWFNAWKFQSSEQVWAGLGYCIIDQVVKQLPDAAQRERFWLELQIERLDYQAIRQDMHTMLLEQFLPKFAYTAIVGGLGLLLALGGAVLGAMGESNATLAGGSGLAAMAASTLAGFSQWLLERHKLDKSPLQGKFARYVKQPDYEGKMGFLSEVERDIRRVFELIVDPKKPVVVFIDDLDRCTPKHVAEVVEAINLFLSGDIPHCYFVVGMDAQAVAGSLEVAYKDLALKLKATTRSYGSLGWYFMDKIIQLQFVIPNLSDDQRRRYLGALFNQSFSEKSLTGTEAEEVADIEKQLDTDEQNISNMLKDKKLSARDVMKEHAETFRRLYKRRPQRFQFYAKQAIERSADEFTDSDPEIREQLSRYAPYLGTTPRTIKRFANLYRFYRFAQIAREYEGLDAATPSALGRWMVMMLTWPELVRWIQWEGEVRISRITSPYDKADKLEEIATSATDAKQWLQEMENTKLITLVGSREVMLYDFLNQRKDDYERLTQAVVTGVW